MANNNFTVIDGGKDFTVDPWFMPTVLDSFHIKPLLEEYVNDEMINKNYDPLNSNDVREFWRLKGIEV